MCAIVSWAGRTKRGQWRQVHARNEGRPAWLLRLAGVNGWFACSTR
jgi:hypothetical protein